MVFDGVFEFVHCLEAGPGEGFVDEEDLAGMEIKIHERIRYFNHRAHRGRHGAS